MDLRNHRRRESSQLDSSSQSQSDLKAQHFFKQIIDSSTQNIISLGNFQFYLGKLKTLLKNPQIMAIVSKHYTLESESQSKILANIPHIVFSALHSYHGKTFKPSSSPILFSIGVPITITVSHIQFQNLTILNLSHQNITSLEPLAFLHAPKLASLQLYANQIYSMEPLIKANFTQLKVITFYQNPTAKMDQFYRIRNKKLNKYQFDEGQANQNLMEDYRFLFKMENMNYKTLTLRNPSRINLKGRGIFKILNQSGTQINLHIAQRIGLVARRRLD